MNTKSAKWLKVALSVGAAAIALAVGHAAENQKPTPSDGCRHVASTPHGAMYECASGRRVRAD